MKAQTTYRTEACTHESFMEFYRVKMLTRYIVDTNAVIRGATKQKHVLLFIQGERDFIYIYNYHEKVNYHKKHRMIIVTFSKFNNNNKFVFAYQAKTSAISCTVNAAMPGVI